MADLVVDLDGLESLVATVKHIQAGLNETKAVAHDSAPAMGSGDVAAAMDHFQSHWNDGRKHIDQNAETMVTMLTTSVRAYRATDNKLATQVTSHTTTTTIGHNPGAQ